MKLAVMQPYFVPYLGYISLIKHTDRFVLFDIVHFIRINSILRSHILKPYKSSQNALLLIGAVSRVFRDKGITTYLLKRCIGYAERQAFQKLRLKVRMSNLSEMAFYRHLEFALAREADHSVYLEMCLLSAETPQGRKE